VCSSEEHPLSTEIGTAVGTAKQGQSTVEYTASTASTEKQGTAKQEQYTVKYTASIAKQGTAKGQCTAEYTASIVEELVQSCRTPTFDLVLGIGSRKK